MPVAFSIVLIVTFMYNKNNSTFLTYAKKIIKVFKDGTKKAEAMKNYRIETKLVTQIAIFSSF